MCVCTRVCLNSAWVEASGKKNSNNKQPPQPPESVAPVETFLRQVSSEVRAPSFFALLLFPFPHTHSHTHTTRAARTQQDLEQARQVRFTPETDDPSVGGHAYTILDTVKEAQRVVTG